MTSASTPFTTSTTTTTSATFSTLSTSSSSSATSLASVSPDLSIRYHLPSPSLLVDRISHEAERIGANLVDEYFLEKTSLAWVTHGPKPDTESLSSDDLATLASRIETEYLDHVKNSTGRDNRGGFRAVFLTSPIRLKQLNQVLQGLAIPVSATTTTIAKVEPLAYLASKQSITTEAPAATTTPSCICGNCGQAAKQRRACGQCQSVYYCSRDCQRVHWPRHKTLCSVPTPVPAQSVHDVVLKLETLARVGEDKAFLELLRDAGRNEDAWEVLHEESDTLGFAAVDGGNHEIISNLAKFYDRPFEIFIRWLQYAIRTGQHSLVEWMHHDVIQMSASEINEALAHGDLEMIRTVIRLVGIDHHSLSIAPRLSEFDRLVAREVKDEFLFEVAECLEGFDEEDDEGEGDDEESKEEAERETKTESKKEAAEIETKTESKEGKDTKESVEAVTPPTTSARVVTEYGVGNTKGESTVLTQFCRALAKHGGRDGVLLKLLPRHPHAVIEASLAHNRTTVIRALPSSLGAVAFGIAAKHRLPESALLFLGDARTAWGDVRPFCLAVQAGWIDVLEAMGIPKEILKNGLGSETLSTAHPDALHWLESRMVLDPFSRLMRYIESDDSGKRVSELVLEMEKVGRQKDLQMALAYAVEQNRLVAVDAIRGNRHVGVTAEMMVQASKHRSLPLLYRLAESGGDWNVAARNRIRQNDTDMLMLILPRVPEPEVIRGEALEHATCIHNTRMLDALRRKS